MTFLAASHHHTLASAKTAAGGLGRWWGAESYQDHLSPSAPFPCSLLQLSLLPRDIGLKQRRTLQRPGHNREQRVLAILRPSPHTLPPLLLIMQLLEPESNTQRRL